MRLEDIHEKLRAQPFEPFGMHISNGSAPEVRHPDMVLPGEASLVLGLLQPNYVGQVYQGFATIAYSHITHLETLPVVTPPIAN